MCHLYPYNNVKLLRKFFFTLIRQSNVLAWGTKKFPLGGVEGNTGPPNVNLGPPKISETTGDKMLKLKTLLDIVKYSHWAQKFLR